jgi:hypothetical protein
MFAVLAQLKTLTASWLMGMVPSFVEKGGNCGFEVCGNAERWPVSGFDRPTIQPLNGGRFCRNAWAEAAVSVSLVLSV